MNNELVEKMKEIEAGFGDKFGGLPPNWCRNCLTLGAAFPKDYKCGNCNYEGIGHFQEYLRLSIIALLEADVERLEEVEDKLLKLRCYERAHEISIEIKYKKTAIEELKNLN